MVPRSSTGSVSPFSVSSPSIVTSSPERTISCERNESVGWRSASKNSGLCRCASRFGSFTCTLETSAEPSSAPSRSSAEKDEKVPLKVPAMYSTLNPISEWTGSAAQVPTGTDWRVSAVLIDLLLVLRQKLSAQTRVAEIVAASNIFAVVTTRELDELRPVDLPGSDDRDTGRRRLAQGALAHDGAGTDLGDGHTVDLDRQRSDQQQEQVDAQLALPDERLARAQPPVLERRADAEDPARNLALEL